MSCAADSRETARRSGVGSLRERTAPLAVSTTFRTRMGFMSVPPLAMAATAFVIWRGVAATPCPKLMVASAISAWG